MNFQETVARFKEFMLPCVIQTYGKDDSVAIREEWLTWIDALVKDGELPESAYDWCLPNGGYIE